MMKQNPTNNEFTTVTLLASSKWLFVIVVAIVGVIRYTVIPDTDPMDNSIMTSQEVVEHVLLRDKTGNGFRVVYATANQVSKARFNEISSRRHIIEGFEKMEKDAKARFDDMLTVDIYEIADFVLQYESDPDIVIHNIFIWGKTMGKLYIGNSPNIENSAQWFDSNTEQGALYLKRDDIYFHKRTGKKIYRYWKCKPPHATSSIDERYAHFSEKQRVR